MENDVSACAPSLSSTTTALHERLFPKFLRNSVWPNQEPFGPFTVADLRFLSLLVLTSALFVVELKSGLKHTYIRVCSFYCAWNETHDIVMLTFLLLVVFRLPPLKPLIPSLVH